MSDTTPYKILLADDHVLIRHGIKRIIAQNDALQVIGEVSDGEELLDALEKNTVDLIILDIGMPKIGGIEAVGLIKSRYPWIKVLMLTLYNTKEYFCHAMAAGADGYLVKDDSEEEVLVAITTVKEGKKYIYPAFSEGLGDDELNSYRRETHLTFQELTRREREILKLVVDGHTSRQIADHFGLSPRTVDHHRASLLRKFKMKSSVDLVNFVVRNGLITS